MAKLAGVSTATASRVLSDSGYGVNPQLRDRVLAAARELHYVPNAHARALASASSSSVGVIVHDVADPYFAEIVQGILDVADQTGRLTMICHTARQPDKELEYLALLRAQQMEAVIVASSGFDDTAISDRMREECASYAANSVRLAFIGRHLLDVDMVLPDNRGGGQMVAEALLDRGHRVFGVIAGPEHLTVTNDRLAGFRETLERAGITLADDHVIAGGFTRDGGGEAARELLEHVPGITAIYALNDLMAIGALHSLQQLGVDVPGQISLVGFDDIAGARDTTPPLSTVHVPLSELGKRALQLALSDEGDRPRAERVPTSFVARASIGPAPQAGAGDTDASLRADRSA